jgi:hypothetical protein
MHSTGPKTAQDAARDGAESKDPRPPYEPPRITKRRSVARTTLFTGATAQGIVTEGPTPPPATP